MRTVESDSLGAIVSGCHPLRHSSPMVGFCVHRLGAERLFQAAHTLHPIHSRISSGRPALILAGKKGSAIDGRAAPIMSTTPRRMADTIVSGEV